MFAQMMVQAQIKKNIKLRVTGLCEGNSPVIGEFPAQKASDAEMFPFDDIMMVIIQNDWCGVKKTSTMYNI